VVTQTGEQGTRDGADAGLNRRPVGDPLGDVRRDPLVYRGRVLRRDLDERTIDGRPADRLAVMHQVRPERPGHLFVHLEEERNLADEARDVVAVRTQREVAMPVHR
jgi:hypothetical protein